MPDIIDIFNQQPFSMLSLTQAVEKMPYHPRRLGELNLFQPEPLDTTTAVVDIKDGRIQVLSTKPRGGEPNKSEKDPLATTKAFSVPHIPVEDRIMADSLQGKRMFGMTELETVANKVNSKFEQMRRDMETTWEIHRLGALKGTVLDADGGTIFNYFTEFGESQQTLSYELDVATTDVRGLAVQTRRLVEDELGNVPFDGVRVLCGRQFFDALTSHPNVKEAYVNQQSATLRDDLRDGFFFGGIMFEEYRGLLSGSPDTIADTEAYAAPMGASGVFRVYWGASSFLDTVNTMGVPMLARQAVDTKYQRWVDLYLESNPLHINTRPRSVIKLTLT